MSIIYEMKKSGTQEQKITYNTTRAARIMHLIVVIFQLVVVVEMFVAHLTIVVPTTLDIMLLQTRPRGEVPVAAF